MYAAILAEFRVEGGSEDSALANEGGRVVPAGEDRDLGAEGAEARGANVNGFERAAGKRGLLGADGRVILAAVRVALDGGIEDAEAALGRVGDLASEQNAAGTGAEDGFCVTKIVEDVVEAGALEMFQEGRRFTAGDDEGVKFGELVGPAYEAGYGTEFGKTLGVDVESALEGEDADDGGYLGHDVMRIAC